MRAMQIIDWGKPLEAREYPDPEPKGEEVLLRVEAAGVCHSDVHIWDGISIWAAGSRSRSNHEACACPSPCGTKLRARWWRRRSGPTRTSTLAIAPSLAPVQTPVFAPQRNHATSNRRMKDGPPRRGTA